MGEYAIRRSDNERVKIGTCEDMYYLRYEDRDKVKPEDFDMEKEAHQLRFRLPFPDEDNIEPGGNYQDFRRGLRLWRKVTTPGTQPDRYEDFNIGSQAGSFQMRHESGLMLSVPCYHGNKLPEVPAPLKASWNGKSWHIELMSLRPTEWGQVLPIVGCRFCGDMWRLQWATVWEYIEPAMKKRLRGYMEKSDPEFASLAEGRA